ncbi:hypothetical protein IV203_027090 [Nitzschia inconspicua]|uniref:Hemerythrin-like domain-containing protein n=1 Tax=Nitzschia inconspicua TaxID=303405 RepID=A0A9K3LL09_9STRA|nr:hypothetical protein IV203_027090 [Nitzschia inconspicua]
MPDPVGNFAVCLAKSDPDGSFEFDPKALVPSSRLLQIGKPTVIHFYNGGDGDGNFVSRKTKAYLDFGEEAFDHVEQILAGLLRDKVVGANFSSSSQQPSNKTTVAMEEYLTVPSVGVSSMDHEHETCLTALKNLIHSPSKKNLQVVYEELMNHFAHEEALMVEHGFGGTVGDPFSPLTSHIKDHRRILDLVEHELKLGNNTSAAGTCNTTVDGVAS